MLPELWGGMECTINRVKDKFRDQLEMAGHYQRPEDLTVIASLGIKKMRFPLLWEKHQPDWEGNTDWTWADHSLGILKENNIEPIVGLVHHGSGPAFTNLLDKKWPELLANFAESVAKRYPWLNMFTPVNEPLTTARFSGLYGFWYPHKTDELSFIRMPLNQLKGTIFSMERIHKINPSARLVQTEDLTRVHSTAQLAYQAHFENKRRWLTYDLLCGKVVKSHFFL